jgi:hypothetical protein
MVCAAPKIVSSAFGNEDVQRHEIFGAVCAIAGAANVVAAAAATPVAPALRMKVLRSINILPDAVHVPALAAILLLICKSRRIECMGADASPAQRKRLETKQPGMSPFRAVCELAEAYILPARCCTIMNVS